VKAQGNSHPREIDCGFSAYSEFIENNPQYNLSETDMFVP